MQTKIMMSRAPFTLLLSVCLLAAVYTSAPAQVERTYIYTIPSAGAQHISPGTSVAVRLGPALDIRRLDQVVFDVSGSRSGVHTGDVVLADDGRTLLFYPHAPFAYDESVSVALRQGARAAGGWVLPGVSFEFRTLQGSLPAQAADLPLAPAEPTSAQAAFVYQTHPEFTNLMPITVTTPAQGTAEGLIFLTSTGIGNDAPPPALFILDDSGEPVYIQPTQVGLNTTDFKRQTVGGVPYLVYHTGVSVNVWTNGSYYVLDQGYNLVDTWTIGNGYGADEHEMQLLDNGNALLLSYVTIPWDLSPYGGPADGQIVDILIQEQDPSKNVIFEWHGSQHVPLTDTYSSLTRSPVDYMHTNAIEADQDGNLLISNRNTSDIVKINRQTGDIIWRLGGKANEFDFTNDVGFTTQHDIRRLANGHITLFDNGNMHVPAYSRAVEYTINEQTKEVTRVWQYPEDTSLFAPFMGSAQRLDNGNTIIGWGAIPRVSEIRPDGSKALELALGGLTYRAFKYAWDAFPSQPPRVTAVTGDDPTTVELYFSWNGATQIQAYEVYTGSGAGPLTQVDTVPRTGFETSTTLTGLDSTTCTFVVRPVHALGLATPYSTPDYRLDTEECRALTPYRVFMPVAPQGTLIE